ncbi:MAG: DNA adenine methylase [Bacilli bacterium]|nr:DNA adenine methylase [Bacilli bacterium]MDD4077436.1 DNA adenine methylase [Bacilli bacterium]
MKKMNAKPIVKWAGGKRQLIDKLIKHIPNNYNRYFEPFVGGGALLFELLPNYAVINDINKELLTIYRCLANKKYFKSMIEELNFHEGHHSEEYYYQVREEDRKPDFLITPIWQRAARVIYLNKSCFNGLYRVNSKGYFNVPSGKKSKVNTYDFDNISKLHRYFITADVTILEGDFTDAVENAAKGDFVYFDPPYDSFDDKDSFTAYSKHDFTKQDQIRLYNTYKKLSDKGIHVMLSNHNTQFINELYKDYNIQIVKAKRMINSDSKGRGNVEETIITNY